MSTTERKVVLTKPYIQILNKGEDDETICYAYKTSILKSVFYYFLILLTLGLVIVLFYWKPNWKIYLTCSKSNVKDAEFFILHDSHGRYFTVKVQALLIEDLLNLSGTQSNLDVESFENEIISAYNTKNRDRQQITNHDELIRQKQGVKYFVFQKLKYAWNREHQAYEKVRAFDYKTKVNTLLHSFHGYSEEMQALRRKFYGLNSIEVEVKSYPRLFFQEVMNPFYVFQIMSCALWLYDNYYLYAICIMIISLISVAVSLIETRRQAQTLHDMVTTHLKVNVKRANGTFEEIPAELLVPGDVIAIPETTSTMSCDAVLLNGTCIVNESMLTGESVPVIKTPLPQPETPDDHYNIETHKRHTLFSGTNIVQTRSYDGSKIQAVVIRTGFSTAKGDLVHSILFPKPVGFKFYKDSIMFILMLFCLALVGMSYGATILKIRGVDIGDIIIRALDIITIVVPPALPAAMTVGTVYAQNRLKKKQIYCISPPRINICGKLKLICFDKTGTLTEDGLDLWGVMESTGPEGFNPVIHDPWLIKDGNIIKCMAACHSITKINGEVIGDPLDVKMFESTKWSFTDDPREVSKFEQVAPIVKQNRIEGLDIQNEIEIAILKQFTFSSSLLRMSVVCKTLGSQTFEVFTKGAPEKIVTLCKPETIPTDFESILHKYTVNGFRVIALAGKNLDPSLTWLQASKLQRENFESDLDFYGLLIMQNMIKPVTPVIINELTNADIGALMVTGDNLLTAISVARNCGLIPHNDRVILVEAYPPGSENPITGQTSNVPARIEWKSVENVEDFDTCNTNEIRHDRFHEIVHMEGKGNYHFAMTGKSFAVVRKYFPDYFKKILVNGRIFARMSPDQKAQLVEHLIELDYCVGMCGDGANDCGALKAAHVGVSLSEAEASVASPFTSKVQDISCIPEVIKEGRAALATSFGVFKFMALYSVTQFVSVLILYWIIANLSDAQFLYVDLFIIIPISVFMSGTGAHAVLAKKRPLGSLVSFTNVSSILFQVLFVIVFQIAAFLYLQTQSWFVPLKPTTKHFKQNTFSMETTTVFLISTFQYAITAFVFSKAPLYRKSILENAPFVVCLVLLVAANLWITIAPLPFMEDLLSLKRLDPMNPISIFRFSLVAMALLNFILSIVVEDLIVQTEWYKKFGQKMLRKKQPKNLYKRIKEELKIDKNWPMVGKFTFSEAPIESNVVNSSDYKY